MNSCTFGGRGCIFSAPLLTNYQERIFETLLDPIDVQIEVLRVDYEKLSDDQVGYQTNRFVLVCKRQKCYRYSQADEANRIKNTSEQFLNIFLLSLGRKDKRYAKKIAYPRIRHRHADRVCQSAHSNGSCCFANEQN